MFGRAFGGKGVTMFTRMYTWLQVRLQDEEGATAVEYALMVADRRQLRGEDEDPSEAP